MTPTQRKQFNRMRDALTKIARQYETPEQIRRSSWKKYGLDFDEAIGYAYENIQGEARVAVCGVKAVE